jgi:hypothetical protein
MVGAFILWPFILVYPHDNVSKIFIPLERNQVELLLVVFKKKVHTE